MKIKANLILPDTGELMKSVGLNEGGKVQKYIDGFIFDHSEPYLPGYHFIVIVKMLISQAMVK